MKYTVFTISCTLLLGCQGIKADPKDQQTHLKTISKMTESERASLRSKADSYWKSSLSPSQYEVCRHDGTERPHSGEYVQEKRPGSYLCSSCGAKLFHSEHKYKSGTGWPSFYDVPESAAISLKEDNSWFTTRTEVRCATCDAHLGHVFDDGPPPTSKRYCINSVCLIHEADLPK